jgi:hypothetical protein
MRSPARTANESTTAPFTVTVLPMRPAWLASIAPKKSLVMAAWRSSRQSESTQTRSRSTGGGARSSTISAP